jgi:predicted SAM-dependent methyltransferase
VTKPYPQPQESPRDTSEAPVRLNWGSGEHPEPGWINSDVKDGPGIDISCDIREGLPLGDASIDYITSIHALPEIPLGDLVGALRELRRVLKPGGVLRLGLPDLDKGIEAYMANDRDYFLIPDEDAVTIGGKFVTQLLWYGWSRTLFTHDFTEELLREAGYSETLACAFRETKSRFPEIVELDSRERESFFVEAIK